MFAFRSGPQTASGWRVLPLLGVLAAVVLAIWIPASAHASSCENSWKSGTGGSWFTAGNWSKGTVPTSTEEVCITAEGAYTVLMDQTSTTGIVSVKSLTIGASAGSGTQLLEVRSTCSLHAIFATTNGITIGTRGEMEMTNGDGCGDNVTFEGPISNAGRITTRQQNGGLRQLQGSLTNTGTLVIQANTSYNGASAALKNEGTIKLEEKELIASNKASVTNATGGKIAATGSGDVSMEPETSFTEGEGTTSGPKPVIVRDAALIYSGKGASTIAIRGEHTGTETPTISGSIAAGQALSVESTCAEHALVGAPSGLTNAGSITLTNADGCTEKVRLTITGTLTNSGTITSEPATGGERGLRGNVTNTGTLNINAPTKYDGEKAALKNEGAINVADKEFLEVSNKASLTNATGGKIAATGSGAVFMEPETSFTEAEGTTSGSKPVIVRDAALTYSGKGASTIAIRGEHTGTETPTVSGSTAAGQALSVESTCAEHAFVGVPSGLTNAGSITLTNADGCSDRVHLTITGTLTNSGTITSEPAIGGERALQGNLTNTGTLQINANTEYNGKGGALKNEGAINVADKTFLTASNESSVTNGAGGKIAGTGTGTVFMEPGTSFTEGAGTTSGSKPVIVRDAALTYSGKGASTIAIRGEHTGTETPTVSGSIAAGQALSVESTCAEHALVGVPSGLTNAGSITLTNADGCSDKARLTITGTLTNSGTITSEPATGGERALLGNITNSGTLQINANTNASTNGATLTNTGAVNVANGVALSIENMTVNNEGGTITGTGSGTLFQKLGTFNEGLGKTSGTKPVILDDTALHYANKGASTIAIRGEGSTLSGTINAGQTLSIESTCAEHVKVTGATFVNSGTIVLTNADGCGDNVTLNLAGSTLENKGTVKVEEPHGGFRHIEGNLKNEKSVALGASASLVTTGTFVQTSKGTLTTKIASAGSFGSLSAGSTSTLAGTLSITAAKTFKPSLGQSFAIISAASRSGTFTKVKGAVIPKSTSLYYDPIYSATGVTLVVTQAKLAPMPSEGAAGSMVKLNGTGFPAGDTVKLSFTDAKGAKTTLPNAVANGSGEFESEVMVPAAAAKGAGKFSATDGVTGVVASATFTVT